MRIDQSIENFILQKFPQFGINKKIQAIRLLYEISKRENIDYETILPLNRKLTFAQLKKYLIERRYPSLDNDQRKALKFNDLNLDPANSVKIKDHLEFYPKNIFIEESVRKSDLAIKISNVFPDAQVRTITRYKNFLKQQGFTINDYNLRTDNVFIVEETHDYLKPCPCSTQSVSCGYANLKIGTGCPYECTYCFLQSYTNSPGIVLPANLNDFFNYFELRKKKIRLGSGQFTDSLVFDHLTGYSARIVDFFREHNDAIFEFKTKSDNVDLLCLTEPAENIVVSWSLNPQSIIDANEFYTASLENRLNAAKRCVAKGYSVAFHFDPIIYCPGWEEDYKALVDRLFSVIPANSIKWISLGCLRMTCLQKQIIESRFPQNHILDGELVFDYDQKLRYPSSLRKEIFSLMKQWIQMHDHKVKVYLCMEKLSLYQALKLSPKAF